MQLRVKDLRQYLLLRNIPTDTCREKEDLVDLVLCHQGTRGTRDTPRPVMEEDEEDEEEDEDDDTCGDEEEDGGEDTDSLHSLPHSHAASPPSATRSASEQSVLSASQGDVLSPSDSSGTPSQVSPATERRIRASLSDLDNEEAIENLSVRQLKEILARNFVNYSGCCEKWELLDRVHRLYRENEQNRKSNGVRSQLTADENLCRICMDAIIDCVLLECGHMVTCTKCGKRMSECPICRQYVVRATRLLPLACKVPTPQISLRLTLLTGPTCPPAAPGLPLYTADTITTPCFKSLLAGDETRWSCGRFEGVCLLIVVI
ncbi:hypothetical protein GOODEAATRI_007726 [Goodea atripinnis]|uniref:RING-type domain-containing protein n=1 Tax=Goodea atripinnis TaxID=208336 RepID=A0ABV0MZI5_9TELE